MEKGVCGREKGCGEGALCGCLRVVRERGNVYPPKDRLVEVPDKTVINKGHMLHCICELLLY